MSLVLLEIANGLVEVALFIVLLRLFRTRPLPLATLSLSARRQMWVLWRLGLVLAPLLVLSYVLPLMGLPLPVERMPVNQLLVTLTIACVVGVLRLRRIGRLL